MNKLLRMLSDYLHDRSVKYYANGIYLCTHYPPDSFADRHGQFYLDWSNIFYDLANAIYSGEST